MKRLLVAPALAGALLCTAPVAEADSKPVNEGSDTSRCVTYQESLLVFVGTPRHKAQRVFDTKGKRISKHALDHLAGVVGADRQKHRQVRSYPVCVQPELGVNGGTMIVEFSTSKRERARAVYYNDW